jgi:rubrerythrin
MDIIKILEYALAREYQGKQFFIDYADRLQNAEAVGAFKTIAAEEQKHIDFILAQIAAYNQEGHAETIDLAWVHFFTDQANSMSIEQIVSESMVADLPVLRMAYLIEHDFAEFYNTMAQKVEGEPRKLLEMLARWESGHERVFKRMHDTLFEKYADMPWGG